MLSPILEAFSTLLLQRPGGEGGSVEGKAAEGKTCSGGQGHTSAAKVGVEGRSQLIELRSDLHEMV